MFSRTLLGLLELRVAELGMAFNHGSPLYKTIGNSSHKSARRGIAFKVKTLFVWLRGRLKDTRAVPKCRSKAALRPWQRMTNEHPRAYPNALPLAGMAKALPIAFERLKMLERSMAQRKGKKSSSPLLARLLKLAYNLKVHACVLYCVLG